MLVLYPDPPRTGCTGSRARAMKRLGSGRREGWGVRVDSALKTGGSLSSRETRRAPRSSEARSGCSAQDQPKGRSGSAIDAGDKRA